MSKGGRGGEVSPPLPPLGTPARSRAQKPGTKHATGVFTAPVHEGNRMIGGSLPTRRPSLSLGRGSQWRRCCCVSRFSQSLGRASLCSPAVRDTLRTRNTTKCLEPFWCALRAAEFASLFRNLRETSTPNAQTPAIKLNSKARPHASYQYEGGP